MAQQRIQEIYLLTRVSQGSKRKLFRSSVKKSTCKRFSPFLSALHVVHNIRSLQMAERISWLKNAAPFPSHGADRVGMWMRRRTQYQHRAISARRQDRENGEAIRVKMISGLKYENWLIWRPAPVFNQARAVSRVDLRQKHRFWAKAINSKEFQKDH